MLFPSLGVEEVVTRLSYLWVREGDRFFFFYHSEIKSGELDIFISVSWGQQDGAIPTKDIQENPSVYHTSFHMEP